MDTGRRMIRVAAVAAGGLLVLAGPVAAQHGGGGHGGGGHAGGGHFGGGHYSGGGHYYGGGGHYGGYYGRYYGPGHSGRYYGGHSYYPRFRLYGGLYGYFGYPSYYGYPYYYGYGYPYYGYGGYGYNGYAYGGYGNGRYEYDDTGAVRLEVEPDDARVFVDGYYAGIADDFNGRSERLRLPAGRHEIALKLEGYNTHRIKVDVPVDQTLRIRHLMVRGTGEDSEDLTPDGYRDETRGPRGEGQPGGLPGWGSDRDRGDRPRGRPAVSAGLGAAELRLAVRPGDAVIYVDGEYRGPGGQVRRLALPPGRHSVEVVRPGFQTFERALDLERDTPADLDVELRPAG